jgi:hypothetical protein
MPVEQLRLGTQQDGFRKRSRTCAEVIGSFAHIHSRSDLVGHAINQQELHRMAKRQSVLCTPVWRLKKSVPRYTLQPQHIQQGGESSSAPCVSAYSCGSSSSAPASSGCSSSTPSWMASPSSSTSSSSSSPSTSEGSCTRSSPTSVSSLASLIKVTP